MMVRSMDDLLQLRILIMTLFSQVNGQLKLMAFDQQELWERANERLTWHERLEGEEAVQNRVHE